MIFFPLEQKAGDFLVHAGFDAENEILHTLAFLAGVMIWSQVLLVLAYALLQV